MMDQLLGKLFDEFPQETNWDVIVIGGGPNGLMTAAYLAKAGAKVVVVERRYEVGGGLATEEKVSGAFTKMEVCDGQRKKRTRKGRGTCRQWMTGIPHTEEAIYFHP